MVGVMFQKGLKKALQSEAFWTAAAVSAISALGAIAVALIGRL
jgi:hypothetical protein